MKDFSIGSRLSNADLIGINKCFSPVEKTYKRGEIITICSSDNDTIGIIASGTAYLSTNNNEDQRRILNYYETGDIFGMHFIPQSESKAFYIIAKTNCTIICIKYKNFITCCKNSCDKHNSYIDSLIMLSVKKHLMHIDILSQRSLRSKLISFFEYLKTEKNKSTFILPLPLADLADYLAVDRSAMMREIKNLNDECIIKSDKRRITIL